MRHRGFLSCTLLMFAIPCFGGDFITPVEIEAEVRQYLNDTLRKDNNESSNLFEITVSNLDPRLQLRACDTPLRKTITSPRPYGTNVSVKLQCNDSKRWTIYVPAQIDQFAEVAVLSRSLSRGSVISEADITLTTMNTAKAGFGHIRDPERAIGMQLKRPLQAGEPLRISHLRAPEMVKKGDRVTLEASTVGVTVITAGKALGKGQLGDQIQVRNTKSDRVVDAEIIAPGRVKVSL